VLIGTALAAGWTGPALAAHGGPAGGNGTHGFSRTSTVTREVQKPAGVETITTVINSNGTVTRAITPMGGGIATGTVDRSVSGTFTRTVDFPNGSAKTFQISFHRTTVSDISRAGTHTTRTGTFTAQQDGTFRFTPIGGATETGAYVRNVDGSFTRETDRTADGVATGTFTRSTDGRFSLTPTGGATASTQFAADRDGNFTRLTARLPNDDKVGTYKANWVGTETWTPMSGASATDTLSGEIGRAHVNTPHANGTVGLQSSAAGEETVTKPGDASSTSAFTIDGTGRFTPMPASHQ
jgi:hypothetical protein